MLKTSQQTRNASGFHGEDLSTLSQAPNLDRETSVCLSWWKRQSLRPQETEGEEMTYAARSNLKINPSSTSHSKSRLENKHQLAGNFIIMMKSTEGFSTMTKKQVLMGSEPSRIPLNISNTKMRDFFMFSEDRDLSPVPSSSEATLSIIQQLADEVWCRLVAPREGWGHSCPDICSISAERLRERGAGRGDRGHPTPRWVSFAHTGAAAGSCFPADCSAGTSSRCPEGGAAGAKHLLRPH